MSGNSALPPRPAMPHSKSIQGWEQTEEVAKRLLDDMRSAEARAQDAKANEKQYGHLVAEAHRRGISVERPWEQEEEVYQRLHDELERLEKEELSRRRPQAGVAGAPTGLSAVNTSGGARGGPATTFLAGAVAPRHSPHATDMAVDWQQDEEVCFRLADEMAKLEQLPGGPALGEPGSAKWIPKSSMLKHTASEAEMLNSPTWEMEQEFEVQQRLHAEMLTLETRADARQRGEPTEGSLADDKAAYDKLQQQLRALESTGVLMPNTDRLGMPRQMSRGSLLPMADSASGVHLRL